MWNINELCALICGGKMLLWIMQMDACEVVDEIIIFFSEGKWQEEWKKRMEWKNGYGWLVVCSKIVAELYRTLYTLTTYLFI